MRFHISGSLRRFVAFREQIHYEEASSVGEALQRLVSEHPGLKPVLFDGQGNVRNVHRLFINSAQIGHDEMVRPLGKDDRVDIVTAIAGG